MKTHTDTDVSRTAASVDKATGSFNLIFKCQPDGWCIIDTG